MRKMALSIAAMAAISGSAMAGGDIAPVAPAPMDSWSGFYLGAQAGYIWGDADTSYNDGTSSISQNVDGFAGGLYGGYNWLLQNDFLIGLEGDINWANGSDSAENGTNEVKIDENWEASLRLRVGKVIDDTWMPYITGGAAWTDLDVKYGPAGGALKSDSGTMTGWTLGAGVEYKFTESLHAKLEYRYSDYGDFTENYKGMKTDYTTNKVYMGISYKF